MFFFSLFFFFLFSSGLWGFRHFSLLFRLLQATANFHRLTLLIIYFKTSSLLLPLIGIISFAPLQLLFCVLFINLVFILPILIWGGGRFYFLFFSSFPYFSYFSLSLGAPGNYSFFFDVSSFFFFYPHIHLYALHHIHRVFFFFFFLFFFFFFLFGRSNTSLNFPRDFPFFEITRH